MRSADHDSANWLLPWRQPESTRGYVPLMWHVALCSGLATLSLYVPCRSVCDRDQNWIKWSKPFWGADQEIKVTSKLLKVNNQDRAAAMWPLTLENQAIKSLRRERSSTLFADQRTWSQLPTLLQATYKWLYPLFHVTWHFLCKACLNVCESHLGRYHILSGKDYVRKWLFSLVGPAHFHASRNVCNLALFQGYWQGAGLWP